MHFGSFSPEQAEREYLWARLAELEKPARLPITQQSDVPFARASTKRRKQNPDVAEQTVQPQGSAAPPYTAGDVVAVCNATEEPWIVHLLSRATTTQSQWNVRWNEEGNRQG